MARKNTGPRYFDSKNGYFCTIDGERHCLAKGPEDDPEVKDAAERKFHELMLNTPGGLDGDRATCKEIVEPRASYFRFITTPNVEPTNNLAEQAIRFVAIHRRLTQGTRGSAGQRWCERIGTVVVTCAQQGRSAFAFLCQAVAAYFGDDPAPGLQPNTS